MTKITRHDEIVMIEGFINLDYFVVEFLEIFICEIGFVFQKRRVKMDKFMKPLIMTNPA
jgi:hypothetical protein